MIDSKVETRISFAAKRLSQPYCSASTAVVAPAGIPVINTDNPLTRSETLTIFNTSNTARGKATSLNKEKYNTWLSNTFFHSISARTDPITIMETADVQRLIEEIVPVTNDGKGI